MQGEHQLFYLLSLSTILVRLLLYFKSGEQKMTKIIIVLILSLDQIAIIT